MPTREELLERVGVQEVFVREPGWPSISGVFGPGLDCDVFANLEAKDELLGRRIEELRPILIGTNLVEHQIAADCRERMAILLQTSLLELGLRELVPGELSALVVDRAEPPFVLPGARPEVDAASGQGQ